MAPRPLIKPRCHNCRRKKIKCDYQQPACGPCSKIGTKCLGYQQETIFVIHEASASEISREALPVVASATPPLADTGAPRLTLPVSPGAVIQNFSDLYDRFLSIYLSEEEQYTSKWLPIVPYFSNRSRVLEAATQALSTMMMGQRTQDETTLVNARMLYGKALLHLRSIIENTRPRSEWPQLLLAVMILQIFETISLSGVQGFISHASGIAIFIQQAGPQAFQDPPLHLTLLSGRASMIARSIFEETPTFLSSTEWKTIPWEKMPKDDYHKLLDVFVQIPTLLYILKRLSKGEDVGNVKAKNPVRLLGTCRYINTALDVWYHEVTNRLGPLHRIVGTDEMPQHPYSVPEFNVCNFSDGQKLLAFWAAKLIVFDVATKALGLYAAAPEDQSPWLDDDYKKKTLEIADSICILALQFFRTFTRVIGMQFPMLPLRCAATCYGFLGRPERQAWCFEQIQRTMDGNYGIWVRNYMPKPVGAG